MKGNSVEAVLDRQIGMEPLAIDWAKEEAKIARIVLNIHFIANKSIFKSII